jgi:hypothetical protein
VLVVVTATWLAVCVRRSCRSGRQDEVLGPDGLASPLVSIPVAVPVIPDTAPVALGMEEERLVSDRALIRLCDLVDVNRRIAAAQVNTSDELDRIDGYRWHVEREMIFDGHRIPFVVFGPAGIFVVVGSDGAWKFADVAILNDAAQRIAAALPDHPVTVRAVIHLPFDADEPRHWTDAAGNSAWVLGRGRLVAWMSDSTGEGFAAGDIAELIRRGGPRWERPGARRLVLNNPVTD